MRERIVLTGSHPGGHGLREHFAGKEARRAAEGLQGHCRKAGYENLAISEEVEDENGIWSPKSAPESE